MFRVGAWKRAEGRQLSRSPLDVLALEDRQHEHLDVEGITEALEEVGLSENFQADTKIF